MTNQHMINKDTITQDVIDQESKNEERKDEERKDEEREDEEMENEGQEDEEEEDEEHKRYQSLFKDMVANDNNPEDNTDWSYLPAPNDVMSTQDQLEFYHRTVHEEMGVMCNARGEYKDEIQDKCMDWLKDCHEYTTVVEAKQLNAISSAEHYAHPSDPKTLNESERPPQTDRMETPTEHSSTISDPNTSNEPEKPEQTDRMETPAEHYSPIPDPNISNESEKPEQTDRMETPTEYIQDWLAEEPFDFMDPDG